MRRICPCSARDARVVVCAPGWGPALAILFYVLLRTRRELTTRKRVAGGRLCVMCLCVCVCDRAE